MLNDRLAALEAYPFARLGELLAGSQPPPDRAPIDMTLGDPRHATPPLVDEILRAHAQAWNRYPPIAGTRDWQTAVAGWLVRRYGAAGRLVDPETGLIPLSGTREGLFMTALLVVPGAIKGRTPVVLLPNPFYAAYEGAAVMAGAESVFLDAGRRSGFLPDLDALEEAQKNSGLLDRTALAYLCSPSNPQGAAASLDYLKRWLRLARQHDFVLAVDECYAEIYNRQPPPGVLQAAADLDGGSLDNLLVFHTLSKRSNAAGLRSGFVAGAPKLIAAFRRLRGYGAAGMPLPIQAASAALWDDDEHAVENRERYRAKFAQAETILADRFDHYTPDGSFFLWLRTTDGVAAARRLWDETGIRVLPGAFLAHPNSDGRSPADPYIRIALVDDIGTIRDALIGIRDLKPALDLGICQAR